MVTSNSWFFQNPRLEAFCLTSPWLILVVKAFDEYESTGDCKTRRVLFVYPGPNFNKVLVKGKKTNVENSTTGISSHICYLPYDTEGYQFSEVALDVTKSKQTQPTPVSLYRGSTSSSGFCHFSIWPSRISSKDDHGPWIERNDVPCELTGTGNTLPDFERSLVLDISPDTFSQVRVNAMYRYTSPTENPQPSNHLAVPDDWSALRKGRLSLTRPSLEQVLLHPDQASFIKTRGVLVHCWDELTGMLALVIPGEEQEDHQTLCFLDFASKPVKAWQYQELGRTSPKLMDWNAANAVRYLDYKQDVKDEDDGPMTADTTLVEEHQHQHEDPSPSTKVTNLLPANLFLVNLLPDIVTLEDTDQTMEEDEEIDELDKEEISKLLAMDGFKKKAVVILEEEELEEG